ncbi:POU domain, class 4, transcription factor 3 [Pangasianodon hypophthalmus]|uniref:POU domain, class 4, transcription factor 3 n=1 Tax=Pangasianodon hypophthalmus TaxID=310915 RepID=UPI000EFE379E|nr:POU domain, class 4, transcription factor 3 [Pangasianodon hypophthalmus]
MNGKQQHFPVHAPVHEPKYSGVHASSEAMRRVCPQLQTNIFGAFDESLLARAEALAAADLAKPHATSYHAMNGGVCATSSSSSSISSTSSHHHHHHHHHHHNHLSQTLEGELLEHLSSALAVGGLAPDPAALAAQAHQHHLPAVACHLHQAAGHAGLPHAHSHPQLPLLPGGDGDSDPRELEAFAERFKQRRIKLGVTQADVGSALANLKIPGVGSLSQSTICRFESLTLSHNNMIALRPVLQAWLDEAEAAHRDTSARTDLLLNGNGERKRKRTSIAAPEKRSLEAYFAIQPRPSSEKIAAIAEKLDLKKNVVRVWFCNQRQKQKRMKYSAAH